MTWGHPQSTDLILKARLKGKTSRVFTSSRVTKVRAGTEKIFYRHTETIFTLFNVKPENLWIDDISMKSKKIDEVLGDCLRRKFTRPV